MFRMGGIKFKHIQSQRHFQIGRIEVDDIIDTLLWNDRQRVFGKVSVRVHNAQSVAAGEILLDHVLHEAGLTGTGLSDDVQVTTAIPLGNSHLLFDPAVFV